MLGVTKEATHLLSSFLDSGDRVLELGCGSGLAAQLLSGLGFQVKVIELSSKMIDIARRRIPSVTFIEGDYLNSDVGGPYQAILGLAFIHLFPKLDAIKVLNKCFHDLSESGILYLGTTMDMDSWEGWEEKRDYEQPLTRWRKHWTREELTLELQAAGFQIEKVVIIPDPLGKVWMDFVARKK